MPQIPKITTSSGGPPPGAYANDANIAHTPWDFVLTLSQLVAAPPAPSVEGGPEGTTEITKHTIARVLMSPQHMKAFARAISENVAKYEAVYGEIPDVAKAAERRVEELVKEGVIPAEVVAAARAAEAGRAGREETGDDEAGNDQQQSEEEASG